MKDYEYLSPLVKVPLTGRQWAALLSFSYNLGSGNAKKMVDLINAGSWDDLKTSWVSYVNAGGKPLKSLKDRRYYEVDQFMLDVPV